MRKLMIVSLAMVVAVTLLGPTQARAEDIINYQYQTMFKVWDICGWHHCCKPKCDPCCKPCCEPCCVQKTCTKCCEVKCPPCCPKIPCVYPDTCRRDMSEFGRNGMSRRAASH